MRPTTPIRNLKNVNDAIKKFSSSNFSSLRSIHEMSETAYKSYEVKKDLLIPLKNIKLNMEKLNSPRQNFNKTFVANGVIDIFRKKFIKKNNKLFGKKVLAFRTFKAEEIDNIEQFNYISYLIKNEKNKKYINKTKIPAPGTLAILKKISKFESRSMHGQLPIIWNRAKNFNIYDISNNKFIDFTSTIFVSNIGHSNERLKDISQKL